MVSRGYPTKLQIDKHNRLQHDHATIRFTSRIPHPRTTEFAAPDERSIPLTLRLTVTRRVPLSALFGHLVGGT